MPRSDQSGGPWGSGPRGPPDLEEFLRGSQDRLRGLMPGNLGGRGFALIAVAAVVLWGFSGFFRVEPDEVGVVLRFGKFVREVQPGLNYICPIQSRPRLRRKRCGSTRSTSASIRAEAAPCVTCRKKP